MVTNIKEQRPARIKHIFKEERTSLLEQRRFNHHLEGLSRVIMLFYRDEIRSRTLPIYTMALHMLQQLISDT